MLPGTGNYQWAQIGNYAAVQGRHTSIQYAKGTAASVTQVDLPAQPVGSNVSDEVVYVANETKFELYNGGNLDLIVTIPQWIPAAGEISGEIHKLNSQMMGSVSVNQVFASNEIQYGGAWHTYNGVQLSHLSYFGMSGSGALFDVWDEGCQA